MTDQMTPTVPELKRITELASVYRQQLVAAVTPLVRELTRAVREA